MDLSSAKSERVTAILSAVVAVIILAVGVTAHQSRHASVDEVAQLESDLRFQLEVGFRHDANERQARFIQLEEVLAAWQASPQQSDDRALLADWLLEATIRCMPGSIEALPATPKFGPTELPVAVEPERKRDVIVEPAETAQVSELPGPVPTPAEPAKAVTVDPVVINTVSVTVEAPQQEQEFVEEQQSVAANSLADPESVEPVRINLTELAARIAGYHDGLDEVETALLTLDSNDLSALGQQVRQLDEMTRHFQFVRMYYDALTESEQRSIIAPRSMRATLTEIERRLDRSEQAQDGDFLGEFDVNHQDRIVELREQLAEVAGRIDW